MVGKDKCSYILLAAINHEYRHIPHIDDLHHNIIIIIIIIFSNIITQYQHHEIMILQLCDISQLITTVSYFSMTIVIDSSCRQCNGLPYGLHHISGTHSASIYNLCPVSTFHHSMRSISLPLHPFQGSYCEPFSSWGVKLTGSTII